MVLSTRDFAHEVMVTCWAHGQNFIKTVLLVLSLPGPAWTSPGISLKCARRAWLFALFLKNCTVVGIDEGNVLSKFRVRKRSGSRVTSERNFLGVVNFGAWRRQPGRYFYCPFSQDLFSGLFWTDSESFVYQSSPVMELWPLSVNPCFWAVFGQFWLAREVGGLRLKRYRPLRVNP